ncbi:serine hydrolase domain-containing protein [Streptomyces sp. WM6378]|uniref:serine hydrolase domain-containing protein n=1 Tax=Streptomyces sp. WM6378 TaxID=1415557 RepID=UPI0006AE233F|nr:serine hydrolase domain-containing protein [Streptomyces sp. WM6378]KOU54283.1 penicillin-binding protein [Streptomyces sp. WM6378]
MSKNVSWDERGNWRAEGEWGADDSGGERVHLDQWQAKLDRLRQTHHVPGATLAVLTGGKIHELASGILHTGTGVEATTDSVFQLGSLAKTYTATLVMQLVDAGKLDLDAPVREVLADFTVADEEASRTITPRQLLSHTSGLTCDFTFDSGRGDDCLELYVDAAKGVALDCPSGSACSYSSLGFNVLGRMIEVITGTTWDQALKDLLLAPLGVTHTMTLPEEALSFRAAMGHLGEYGEDPAPAPAWDMMPRSAGPYGRVIASAGDVARLAQLHLAGGTAPDGTRVLTPGSVSAMQTREVDSPDKWTVHADGWGLGWTLYDWNGITGFGHDGASIGQYGFLRVVPSAGVAVVLLTNGGDARRLYEELFADLLGELAGVRMPAPFGPPAEPVEVDFAPLTGTYEREGVLITVSEPEDGKPHLVYEFVGGMKDFSPPLEMDLVAVTDKVFAGAGSGAYSADWMPVVFSTLQDGTACCYIGMRCAPKVA